MEQVIEELDSPPLQRPPGGMWVRGEAQLISKRIQMWLPGQGLGASGPTPRGAEARIPARRSPPFLFQGKKVSELKPTVTVTMNAKERESSSFPALGHWPPADTLQLRMGSEHLVLQGSARSPNQNVLLTSTRPLIGKAGI